MIDGWELSMLSIKSQSLLQFDPAVALTGVSFSRYSARVHRGMAQKTGACLPRQFSGARGRDFMLVCISGLLGKADVADFRRLMDAHDWEDGRSTAGAQSAMVKQNQQLPPDSELSRTLGNRIISALTANPRFLSAAIPLRIFPPLFNRYASAQGHRFGIHVDNAVRGDYLTGLRIRTDLSATC